MSQIESAVLVKLMSSLQGYSPLTYSVAQLYEASAGSGWEFTGMVGAIFVAEQEGDINFFFKLVDMNSAQIVWEHEFYQELQLTKLSDLFYAFESDEGYYGFNFAEGSKVAEFKKVADACGVKLLPQKPKEKEKKAEPKKEKSGGFLSWLGIGKKKKEPEVQPKRPKIGAVSKVQHNIHVGRDGVSVSVKFEQLPPEWQEFLTGMGYDPSKVRDEKVMQAVIEAAFTVATEISAPEPSPAPSPSFELPPPPPMGLGVPPPPPPPPALSKSTTAVPAPPAMALPPPGMPPVGVPPPPPGMGAPGVPPPLPSLGGPPLPPVSVPKQPVARPKSEPVLPPAPNPRAFLADIQKGKFVLNKVPSTTTPEADVSSKISVEKQQRFESELMKRMTMIRAAVSHDDDESESDDEEWNS